MCVNEVQQDGCWLPQQQLSSLPHNKHTTMINRTQYTDNNSHKISINLICQRAFGTVHVSLHQNMIGWDAGCHYLVDFTSLCCLCIVS